LLHMLRTHSALPCGFKVPPHDEHWSMSVVPGDVEPLTAHECATIYDMATSDCVDVRLNGIQMLLTLVCQRPRVLHPLNWDLIVYRLFHGHDVRLLYAAACLVHHQPDVVPREMWLALIKQLPLLPHTADPFDELLLRHPLQQLHQWADEV